MYHSGKFKVSRANSIKNCKEIYNQKGKLYSVDWFSNNIARWTEITKTISGQPNIKCLEIGSWEGRSSVFMLENICNGKGSSLVAIDTWLGSRGEQAHEGAALQDRLFCNYILNTKEYSNLEIYRGESFKVLVAMNMDLIDNNTDKYDLIYIDGSHWAKDVMGDAVLSWELLKKGGVMFFDDYSGWVINSRFPHSGPKVAIDSFLKTYNSMYKILSANHYQMHISKTADLPQLTFNNKIVQDDDLTLEKCTAPDSINASCINKFGIDAFFIDRSIRTKEEIEAMSFDEKRNTMIVEFCKLIPNKEGCAHYISDLDLGTIVEFYSNLFLTHNDVGVVSSEIGSYGIHHDDLEL